MNQNEVISFLLQKHNKSWMKTICELLNVIYDHETKLTMYNTENKKLKEQVLLLESQLLINQATPIWWLELLQRTQSDLSEPPNTEAGSQTPAPTEKAADVSIQNTATTIGSTMDVTSEVNPF